MLKYFTVSIKYGAKAATKKTAEGKFMQKILINFVQKVSSVKF